MHTYVYDRVTEINTLKWIRRNLEFKNNLNLFCGKVDRCIINQLATEVTKCVVNYEVIYFRLNLILIVLLSKIRLQYVQNIILL